MTIPAYAWAGIGVGVAILLLSSVISGDEDTEPGSSCPIDPYAPPPTPPGVDPTPKPGVLAFRQYAIARWGQRPGSPQNIIGDASHAAKASDHNQGTAWDLMTTGLDHGDRIVADVLASDSSGNPHALARRAGIQYLIWNRQMWRAYPWQGRPSGTWTPYTGTSPHTDHVHFSFSRAGAAAQTSLYRQIPVA